MKRLLNALKADITFQFRQGFYYIYLFLTIVYMIIMVKLPDSLKPIAVPLTVFSDPSLVGFFFIGGIVMLEKVQGMIKYLSVTPLGLREYLLSKAISLSLVALTAGTIITLTTYRGPVNWFYLLAGILFASVFFTLYGFIAAGKSRTINQYFINMVPYLLLIVLPCFSVIGFQYDFVFNIFPSVAALRLILGAFNGLAWYEPVLYIMILVLMNSFILKLAVRTFEKMTVSEEA